MMLGQVVKSRSFDLILFVQSYDEPAVALADRVYEAEKSNKEVLAQFFSRGRSSPRPFSHHDDNQTEISDCNWVKISKSKRNWQQVIFFPFVWKWFGMLYFVRNINKIGIKSISIIEEIFHQKRLGETHLRQLSFRKVILTCYQYYPSQSIDFDTFPKLLILLFWDVKDHSNTLKKV